MFENIEEAFDQITLAIEREVAIPLHNSIGLGRDDRFDPALFENQHQAVSVISLIGEKCLGICIFQQRLRLAEVRGLARG